MTMQTPAEKIKRAKMQLILSEPFFATLMLSMEVKEDNNIKRIATNGETITYNSGYINGLKVEEVKGLLCSAVMKVANLHHLRRAGRDKNTWNKASEYSVNPIIKNANFALPAESLISAEYKDMAAEQIFKLLPGKEPDQQPGQGPQNEPGSDPGNEDGPGNSGAVEVQDSPAKSEGEKLEQEAKVKQKVSQAIQIQRGKQQGDLPGYLQELIEEVLTPKINWHEVLARFITDISRNDYSYKKPNTRFLHTGFYLPSLYNEEPGKIVFIVDTSSSIDTELFYQFAGELQEVAAEIRTPITVIYVDTKVQGTQDIEPDEKVKLTPKGRGGTKFSPGFNYIDENDIEAKAIIYLTDGECNEYPKREPDAPVLWAVYDSKHFSPPFGEVIQID